MSYSRYNLHSMWNLRVGLPSERCE